MRRHKGALALVCLRAEAKVGTAAGATDHVYLADVYLDGLAYLQAFSSCEPRCPSVRVQTLDMLWLHRAERLVQVVPFVTTQNTADQHAPVAAAAAAAAGGRAGASCDGDHQQIGVLLYHIIFISQYYTHYDTIVFHYDTIISLICLQMSRLLFFIISLAPKGLLFHL